MLEKRKVYIYIGIAWTLIFAGMSFYWATGGMVGVRSLGGQIYKMALEKDPSLVPIVWLTGFVKLGGCLLLFSLLYPWKNDRLEKIFTIVIRIAGAFLFLYGFLNFITISLAALNILDFDLSSYATMWRLIFWEPFWMLGGILYWMSVKNTNGNQESKYERTG
ncbi:DUF3995 domain-containing protein [Sporosarcina sp. 179-K 3D1 HS]|uniref:DUF3995 domain-containing protein n=1 Tax=Sporosarcina sp. 179-K 3D1 HS TaxID=3232169 RepID=UPI0039A25E2D